MAFPALIAQTASYEATGPYVDTLGSGSALSGYRDVATAYTAGDIADGQKVGLLIYKTGAYANFFLWEAKYDQGNARFSRLAELETGGTISDEDGVDIYVVAREQVLLGFAISDETTDLTTGEKIAIDCPVDCILTRVYFSVKTAPAGSAIQIDVEDEGTSLLNAVISLATGTNNAETSTFASSADRYALSKGDLLTVDVDQIGSGTAGAGGKIIFFGWER
jgi:hypothetical protein